MLFSECTPTHYNAAPVHEVICQLRFPTILTINNVEPADFQEVIRSEFPRYARKQDLMPPRMVNGQPEPRQSVSNYHFLSEDSRWKLNLTKDFIALSTLSYSNWEEFARMLDKPLATFIRLYKPAYFQRVGLRYLNIISREKLRLEDAQWSELIASPYLGALGEADVSEKNVISAGTDLQIKLDSSCQAKIHAGTGHIRSNLPNAPQDPEAKFIFDMDLSMNGNTPCELAAAALETLHGHGIRVFEGAITPTLRRAIR